MYHKQKIVAFIVLERSYWL